MCFELLLDTRSQAPCTLRGEQLCFRLAPSPHISYKHADGSLQSPMIRDVTELKSRKPGKAEEGNLISVLRKGQHTVRKASLGE